MSELETGWEAQAGHGGYRTVPNVAEIKKGMSAVSRVVGQDEVVTSLLDKRSSLTMAD